MCDDCFEIVGCDQSTTPPTWRDVAWDSISSGNVTERTDNDEDTGAWEEVPQQKLLVKSESDGIAQSPQCMSTVPLP